MPTIMLINGLRVVIYPNDHQPAHVHVMGDGNEARFALEGAGGKVELIENYGFKSGEVAKIKAALTSQQEKLVSKWREIHGEE